MALNQERLEAIAGGCYGLLEAEYRRLIIFHKLSTTLPLGSSSGAGSATGAVQPLSSLSSLRNPEPLPGVAQTLERVL